MQAVSFPGSVLSVICPELGTGHAYRYQAQPLQPPAVTLVTVIVVAADVSIWVPAGYG